MVRSAPLEFSGDDRYAAKCGGNLVSNGGASDLSEAHVHDSEDARVKRCLNDEFEVFCVDGFVVVEIVGGSVMVFSDAVVDFVNGCVGYRNVCCERSGVKGFLRDGEVMLEKDVKISEYLFLW